MGLYFTWGTQSNAGRIYRAEFLALSIYFSFHLVLWFLKNVSLADSFFPPLHDFFQPCTQSAKYCKQWIYLLFLISSSNTVLVRQMSQPHLNWQWDTCWQNSLSERTHLASQAQPSPEANTVFSAHNTTVPSLQGSDLLTHINCCFSLHSFCHLRQ